ncbi:MAG: leucine-rich repeat domain-containing protein [Synergistaceae bacterium]|nr:leucine-rich repeat domain-containing protein [Synergistaceae bacterium]
MSIKKFFVFVLLSFFAMGASGAWAVYQGVIPGEDKIVQINETNFPNPKFRAYVRAHFDDGGHSGTQNPVGDGWLGGNELVSASKLNLNDVFSDDISAVTNESIQGLEQLTYLIELRFSNTAITSLSLNKLPHLETLYCWHNPSLKTLDVSAGTKLETLICNDCALEGTLDLRNNTALDDLECYNNPELEVMLPPAGTYRGVRAVYCYGIKAIGPSEFVNGVNTLGPSIFGSRVRTFAASDARSVQADTK